MTRATLIRGVLPFLVLGLSATLVGALPAVTAARPNDEEVSRWVREALREDPRVYPWDVRVRTEDGIVTLSGTVSNLVEKQYAELEAKKIKGVRGVISQLIVETVYRPDFDIRQDVRRRLITSSAIESQGLEVTVSTGEVTLSGAVASPKEMTQAELVASEVSGVKKILNNLFIQYPSTRPDDAIQKDVLAAIWRDVYLVGLPIDVSVQGGVVTLQGKVANAYQKVRAEDDAWTWNVKKVKNDLKVEWWEWWEKKEGVRNRRPMPSNEELKKAVRDEIYQDLRFEEPFEIRVDASSGHVTLKGSVRTYSDKRIAEEDALGVVGVQWVSNLLAVSAERRDDEAIEDDIAFQIASDSALSRHDIDVRVIHGIVTLSGNVTTTYERDHAAKVASRVWGVREVINNLAVDWWPRYNDAALKSRIDGRLASNWETGAITDRIQVGVKDGKAVLTGEVDTWSQYKEAARVASLTEGIWEVDNQLTVKEAE